MFGFAIEHRMDARPRFRVTKPGVRAESAVLGTYCADFLRGRGPEHGIGTAVGLACVPLKPSCADAESIKNWLVNNIRSPA
jgi:hypothetical protein